MCVDQNSQLYKGVTQQTIHSSNAVWYIITFHQLKNILTTHSFDLNHTTASFEFVPCQFHQDLIYIEKKNQVLPAHLDKV